MDFQGIDYILLSLTKMNMLYFQSQKNRENYSGKATGKHGVDAIKLDTDIAKQGYKTMNGVTKHKLGKVTFAHPTFNGNSVKKLQSIQKKAEKAITGNIERPMFSKGAQNQFDKAIQANDSAWKRYHQKRRNYI